MPSDVQVLLQSWSPSLGVTCGFFIAAIFYIRGWLRLRAAFPNLISMSRLIAFIGGLLALWIAVGSPLEVFDDALLSAHMVQHLLLMAVAPPLLLLGAPAVPFLHGIPKSFARGPLGALLRSCWVQWLGRTLTHPLLCLLAPSIALLGWHFPAAFELGLRFKWWHEVEHACFFATGVMLWWPVVQPWPSIGRWPRWSIPLYLFFATLPCDALSAFLTFCDRVIYPSYLTAPALFNMSALADQQFAGALMWLCVTVIYLFPAVVITIQILSPSTQQQKHGAARTAKAAQIDESEFGVL